MMKEAAELQQYCQSARTLAEAEVCSTKTLKFQEKWAAYFSLYNRDFMFTPEYEQMMEESEALTDFCLNVETIAQANECTRMTIAFHEKWDPYMSLHAETPAIVEQMNEEFEALEAFCDAAETEDEIYECIRRAVEFNAKWQSA